MCWEGARGEGVEGQLQKFVCWGGGKECDKKGLGRTADEQKW